MGWMERGFGVQGCFEKMKEQKEEDGKTMMKSRNGWFGGSFANGGGFEIRFGDCFGAGNGWGAWRRRRRRE